MNKKAFVADDHELSRMGIKLLLMEECGFTEVVEAADFDEGLELLERHADVDLIVMDLRMPGMAGPRSLRNLRSEFPQAKIAVLSGSSDRRDILECLSAGVHGYLTKSMRAEKISAALQRILAGEIYVPPNIANGEAGDEMERDSDLQLSSPPPPAPDLVRREPSSLTARQQDVLRELAKGLATKEIARELKLSESTVKIHLAAVFRHLGARNRMQAVLIAQRLKP